MTDLQVQESIFRSGKKFPKRKDIAARVSDSIQRRTRKEKRLKAYGMVAIAISFIFLASLLWGIISNGYTAFYKVEIKLPITFSEELIESKNFRKIAIEGIRQRFPDVTGRSDRRKLSKLLSTSAAYQLSAMIQQQPTLSGTTQEVWLPASSEVEMFIKGHIKQETAEHLRALDDTQLGWVEKLKENNLLQKSINDVFFKAGASREPEMAGILGSLVGSLMVIVTCMMVAFPLGVLTAIYLEEFAPKNKITDFIEVNINNLAAVPSIVFGLLGLSIYLQVFGIPRSASLAGGLTLALMALPVVVIATRTSIRAIPQSIRDGAVALGASKVQTTLHHVLPLAMPGIMTGTILSVARVLGETAPLLMIGMVAFIVDVPKDFLDPATAMPVQIYLWADSPEMGFAEKTSAAIMVLLAFLILANALAVYLRKKFEIRW